MPTVVLLGTMDTKGAEYGFARERLSGAGVEVVVVDCGVFGDPPFPVDVTADEVARAAGADRSQLAAAGDRGAAVAAMAEGAATVVARLRAEGRCDGALSLGGTGGTSIATRALRDLPLGVPKVVVSTAAAGETSHYIEGSDLVLMPSVVDISGINHISARIIANAAAAVAGMAQTAPLPDTEHRPAVAASMFGVTTPCVTQARELLDRDGYEVLVFHMTGTGGKALESLVRQGLVAGVLDVTTTELCDELVGGVFSAGPERLTGAAATGLPQVVSVGALDMVNFGPRATVPDRFADRVLYEHNPSITLMRTTPDECTELGRRLAARVSATTGPAAIFLPLKGISMIATDGGPFHDPEADRALFDAVRDGVDRDRVELIELDLDVNDPEFAGAMAERLDRMIAATDAKES